MNFDYTLGGVFGAICSALLLFVWVKLRLARVEKIRRSQFEIEKREAILNQKESQVSMKLEFKERELERASERHKDLHTQLDTRSKEIARQESLLSDAEHEAEKMRRLYRLKLHQITQMERGEARQVLIRAMEKECDQDTSRRAKIQEHRDQIPETVFGTNALGSKRLDAKRLYVI